MWPRSCKSEVTGINSGSDLPDCATPQNALGSECINPCEGKVCNHGGVCLSCGPDSYKTVMQCNLSADGTTLDESIASQVHSVCDCSNAGPIPPGTTYGGYYGASCNILCQKGGTTLSERDLFNPNGFDGNACNCCCSLNQHSEGDVWIFHHQEVCSDGFPSVESPPDPGCLPASTTECKDQG
jgi:hypothetical protein